MKDTYRETGTIFRRSPLVSQEGEGFASRVRAVVADHARQLQGTLERCKREGGRFTQGMAGKKRTTLPGGVLVETWINPHGLAPTIMAHVLYPTRQKNPSYNYLLLDTGWLRSVETEDGWQIVIWDDLLTYYGGGLVKLRAGIGDGAGSFEGIPVVDANNIYISSNNDRGEYGPPGIAPSEYSGLLMLLAQSLIGAQRTDDIHSLQDMCTSIAAQLPEGLATYAEYPDPKRTGLIRAPNGNYWLIFMKDQRGPTPTFAWQGKAFAVRLTPDSNFTQLNQKIHTGEIYPADAALADGFVLGYCEIAKVSDGLGGEILDYVVFSDYEASEFDEETDDFAKLFAKTDELEPFTPYETQGSKDDYADILDFMWGWTWKWQMRGKDDEKLPGAAVITGKVALTSETYRYYAGYVLQNTQVSFAFDDDNRPSIVYTTSGWYHTLINTLLNPAYYTESEEIGWENAITAKTPAGAVRSTSPNIAVFSIPNQDLDIPNIIYVWFDSDGVLNSIQERRKHVTVSTEVVTTYVSGITVCACTLWRIIETTQVVKYAGLFLAKEGIETTDIEYTNITKTYSDGYDTGGGWNEYYGLAFQEYDGYQSGGSVLYVSNKPGVFWLVTEKGPRSGWTYSYINYETLEEINTESDPPVDLSIGVWKRVGIDGALPLYINPELPCHVSNCFADSEEASYDYDLVSASKNTLSTGRELITILDVASSIVLSKLTDTITDNYPEPVPDFFLYSRPAYNINGYLYADIPLDGLCTTCIETAPSVWIGAA